MTELLHSIIPGYESFFFIFINLLKANEITKIENLDEDDINELQSRYIPVTDK